MSRSSMTEERLRDVAVLTVELEITKTLDVYDVIDSFSNSRSRKKSGRKEKLASRQSTAVQTATPSLKEDLTCLALLDSSSLALNLPNTPSPLPKSKILDVADELLFAAEKEITSLDSRRSGPLLSSRGSARNTNDSFYAKRAMTDFLLSSTKTSLISESKIRNRSTDSYPVPPNSPGSNKPKEENYYQSNGEMKVTKVKPCPHQRQLTSTSCQSNQSKLSGQESHISENHAPAQTHLSMFYKQQQFVERSSQKVKENNSTTFIFSSDAKAISSTSNAVLKQDVETNTDLGVSSEPKTLQRFTPNSSIISVKTSKPEEEVVDEFSRKLNIQKMPSVNIRPEFIIHKGPKISIMASNTVPARRKSSEYFDVVYPPRSETFIESHKSTENKQSTSSNYQFVCDRHIFPSGKLVPSSQTDETRDMPEEVNYNCEEKKSLLISLIKSLTEKIGNERKDTRNCCRIICSLPLLASVVNKIQVDCVKCLHQLNRQLDILVQLMKEELRGQTAVSGGHCCQLDETVQYQIVELELMQDDTTPKQPATQAVRVLKHQDEELKRLAPKKTVSFDSLPSAQGQSTSRKNLNDGKAFVTVKCDPAKNIYSKRLDIKEKKDLFTFGKNRNIIQKSTALKPKLLNETRKEPVTSKSTRNKTLNMIDNKEKTVVEQVVKNLTSKKPILKCDSTEKQQTELDSKKKKNSNALFEVVDQREYSSEFDSWIKERSLKIQQIHNELNKIVEGSLEVYVEPQVARQKYIEKATANDTNSTTVTSFPEADLSSTQTKITENNQNDRTKDQHDHNADENLQEPSQEYAEDFEDDVDDSLNANNHVKSYQKSKTETEISSDSSGEDQLTEKRMFEDNGEESRNFDEKFTNDSSILPTATPIKSKELETCVPSEERTSPEKIIKVDTATSPINFELSQNITNYEEKSIIKLENKTLKSSIALSPINMPTSYETLGLSSSTQTEITGSDLCVKNKDRVHNKDTSNKNMVNLLVSPASTPVPIPVENILKLSLDTKLDSSLCLESKSSNQAMNVIVQLQNPPVKSKSNGQVVELKEFSENLSEKEFEAPKAQVTRGHNTKNVSGSFNDCDHTFMHISCNKAVKDIIEPTVSEVLKQIHKENHTLSTKVDQVDKGFASSLPKHSDLIKPKICLQTKQNRWIKCDDLVLSDLIELATPKSTIDSSNQTEVEKQSVEVQVAVSLSGSVSDKGISARKPDREVQDCGMSYLTMVQSRVETVRSCGGLAASSSQHSSSDSSSSSTSSKSKQDKSVHSGTLSEGEVVVRRCSCRIGDVCSVCVPRLDLSLGELNTRQRLNSENTSSDNSDWGGSVSNSRAVLSVPLHLEPRPPSRIPPAVTSSIAGMSLASLEQEHKFDSKLNFLSNFASKGRYPVFKQFSEVANSVLQELNEDNLKTSMAYSKVGCLFPEPRLKSADAAASSKNVCSYSSSSSEKSGDAEDKTKKGSKTGRKKKFKDSLTIKSPVEAPRIDAVIESREEDSESTYQTSVTSVSVDLSASCGTSASEN